MEQVYKLENLPWKFFLFTGIIFVLNGGIMIYQNAFTPLGLITGILMIILGIGYIFIPYLPVSASPRFQIDENTILIQRRYLGKTKIINWDQINSIELSPYMLQFVMKNRFDNIGYDCDASTSIEIKKSIRKIAMDKGIPVTGG